MPRGTAGGREPPRSMRGRRHTQAHSGLRPPFHPIDPRAPRLLALVDAAAKKGAVSGRFAAIGRAVESRSLRVPAARCR
jgi:hypothetical protein